jgi:hypothetical protein
LTEPVEFSIAFPVEFFGRFLIVSEQDGMFVMDSALVSVGRRIPASLGRLSLGFDIVADCDQGILTNTGGGEFSYNIQIMDNENVLRTMSSSTTAEISDGQTLSVSAGPYEHNISTLNNHKIVISGCLYEWDDNGSVVNELCWQDAEFQFPWNEITNSYTTFLFSALNVETPKLNNNISIFSSICV